MPPCLYNVYSIENLKTYAMIVRNNQQLVLTKNNNFHETI